MFSAQLATQLVKLHSILQEMKNGESPSWRTTESLAPWPLPVLLMALGWTINDWTIFLNSAIKIVVFSDLNGRNAFYNLPVIRYKLYKGD